MSMPTGPLSWYWCEHAIEHAEEQRIGGQPVEAAHLGEERVDAPGVEPLEVVAAERCLFAEGLQLLLDRGHLIGVEEALDHRAALVLERADDVVDRRSTREPRHTHHRADGTPGAGATEAGPPPVGPRLCLGPVDLGLAVLAVVAAAVLRVLLGRLHLGTVVLVGRRGHGLAVLAPGGELGVGNGGDHRAVVVR